MTLSQIMTLANKLNAALRCGKSQALKMAWAYRRGATYAYEISWMNGTRTFGFGKSYDEVRAARIDEVNAGVALDRKPIGSHETNLEPYALAVEPAGTARAA